MAGRGLPVDPATVHAGLVLSQGFELGALTAHPAGNQAILRFAQEHLQCGRTDCREVRPDPHDLLHSDQFLPRTKAERSLPLQPALLDHACAAPRWHQVRLALPCATTRIAPQPEIGTTSGRQPRVERKRRLRAARHPARKIGQHHQPRRFPHFAIAGQDHPQIVEPAREQGIAQHQREQRRPERGRHDPSTGRCRCHEQGERRCQRKQDCRPPRRDQAAASGGKGQFHRGASVCSTSAATRASTCLPSISAAGDNSRRWRSTATASAFTSSGTT